MERFIETIKVLDGQFYNLEAHERRARVTAEAFFGKPLAWEVGRMVIPATMCSGLVKCRVVYDSEVREVSFQPYVMRRIRSLRLVNGDGVDYRYKSTDRSVFARLLEKRGECDDVLIVRDGWVTIPHFTTWCSRMRVAAFTRRRLVCLRGLGGRVCWTRGGFRRVRFGWRIFAISGGCFL